MSEPSEIFKLLPLVAKDVGVVGKTKRNQQQNYNFRAIDDVIDACHAAFAKHGIFLTSEVIGNTAREERKTSKGGTLIYTVLRVKFTFYAPDGSNVSSTAEGEGMDSGDKSTNKAMSAALKYALGQTLLIPFNVTDSENDSPDVAPRSQPKPKPKTKAPPAPMDEDSVIDGVRIGDMDQNQISMLLTDIRTKRSRARANNDEPWLDFFTASEANVVEVAEAKGFEISPF